MSKTGIWTGFKMSFAKNITINDWFRQTRTGYYNRVKIGKTEHTVFVIDHNNYVVGIVVSYKNQRIYLEARDMGNFVEFIQREIAEGHEGIEANLFAINPENLSGIFASIFGSISDTKLLRLFTRIHNDVKQSMVQERKEHLAEENPDEKPQNITKQARDTFFGNFKFEFIFTKYDLENALKSMSDIDKLKVSFAEGLPKASFFSPVSSTAKRMTIELSMHKENPVADKAKAIKDFVKSKLSKDYSSLRIIGLDFRNEFHKLEIGENKQGYGRFDYDEYVKGLPKRLPEDIGECKSMIDLFDVFHNYRETFGENPPTGLIGLDANE